MRGQSLTSKVSRWLDEKSVYRQKLYNIALGINRRYYSTRFDDLGECFVTDEWDTLVILDAAHRKYLRETDAFEGGKWETRCAPGSYSFGFMRSEFVGRNLHDIVYITANPHVAKLDDEIFHAVVNLYDTAWDNEARTVKPEEVTEATKRARREYQKKRFIVHFMQPHFPFIGPEHGNEVEAALAYEHGDGTTVHPWINQIFGRGVSREKLLAAYRENHDVVAPYAKEVVAEEDGVAIITADHSNLIGERGFPIPIRLYGHPKEFFHPDLLKVPWLEFGDIRRETFSEEPTETNQNVDDEVLENRMKALGYR